VYDISVAWLASGLFLLPESILAPSQNVQVIAIMRKKYEYSTSQVRVRVGNKVQLKIIAIDHDGVFKIGSFPNGTSSTYKTGLIFAS
jgi:hypothetical protein